MSDPDAFLTAVPATSPAPSAYPLGPDGVPLAIDGQQVLRGAAIRERLDCPEDHLQTPAPLGEPFLVAGWLSVRGHEVVSLIEAPTDHPLTWFFLLGNGTQLWQEPPAARWNGGFIVLRVVPTCDAWPGQSLSVAFAIREPFGGILGPSPTPGLVDQAGIPFEIDGEPVLKGLAIRDRVTAADEAPFLAAGWLEYVSGDCAGPDGQLVDCSFTGLIDPQRGLGGPDGGVPVEELDGARYQEQADAVWPGGFVVLRARPGCASGITVWKDDRCITVIETTDPPPDLAPSPTPLPVPSTPPVVWDGDIPVGRGEDPVLSLRDLDLNIEGMRRYPSFKNRSLVVGLIEPANGGCSVQSCPDPSLAATLVEPLGVFRASEPQPSPAAPLRFQLLTVDGAPFVADPAVRLPHDLYVLEVRPWLKQCPWEGSCRNALVVIRSVALATE